jgi:myo-inositol-1(or 4)-monophosphatase
MEFKQFIEKSVLEAGKIIIENLNKNKEIIDKGEVDFATHVDHEVELFLRNKIEKTYPDHTIVGEELGESLSTSDYRWFIDPIDGTKNYAHNLPGFSVSVALAKNEEVIASAVYDPSKKELFSASKGEGAFLNGKKIECGKKKNLKKCILVCNRGFSYTKYNRFQYINLTKKCPVLRILGGAALEICYIACGRLDIFVNTRIYPWDFAAGILIAKEAGAKITDFKGKKVSLTETDIIISNSFIFPEVLNIIRG